MSSKNTPDPEAMNPVDAEAPTQQVPVAAAAPAAPGTAAPTASLPATDAGVRRNRFAWVSSPKVAAATVITVLALGGLGGAFALGRATAGHDHGPRGVMVQMGVPGGQGFDGRGFGHERFGGMPMPGQQGQTQPAPQEDQSTPTPAPSDSTDG